MKSRFTLIFALAGFLCSCVSQPVSPPSPSAPIPGFSPTRIIPSLTSTTPATATRTIIPTPTESPTPSDTPGPPSLRGFAQKNHFLIGNYLTGAWFHDPGWQEVMLREFNMAVVSSGFYWEQVEARQGSFNFSAPDEQVAWALNHNLPITGHALLLGWVPYIPDWLAFGGFSGEELTGILTNYISTVMGRYKGQIGIYIVVEDAPLPSEMSQDAFYKKLGYDYIDLAFEIARQTDPSAILIYNAGDNEMATSPTSALTHEIVARLKSKGLVDGVGFEMHLDGREPPDKEEVVAEMRSYGLPVHVTEIDIDLSRVAGTKEERYNEQARIYGDMLSACIESGVCESFSLWGIGDKYSWLRRASSTADPTPFDDNLNPKPAYFALLDALRAWQNGD
jgi:endo-1,4-beta-xylanase